MFRKVHESSKLSKLGVMLIAIGFLLLVMTYIVQTRSETPTFLLSMGWFTITTGMFIIAVMYVIFALKRIAARFGKKKL